jgi:alpha-amylase
MNWDDIENSDSTKAILTHWRKLGKFRNNHPAIGAGRHKLLPQDSYIFSRTYSNKDFEDKVVVGLDLPKGKKSISIEGIFEEGSKLYDAYSETEVLVKNGAVVLENDFDIALLELRE